MIEEDKTGPGESASWNKHVTIDFITQYENFYKYFHSGAYKRAGMGEDSKEFEDAYQAWKSHPQSHTVQDHMTHGDKNMKTRLVQNSCDSNKIFGRNLG